MSIFFTSDLHLGDEFYSSKDRESEIINNINNDVKENDTLYILGDFASKYIKQYRNKIKCKNIHLVKGEIDKDTQNIFSSVDLAKEITYKGWKIFMCHYPINENVNTYFEGIWLHGHDHLSIDTQISKDIYCDKIVRNVSVFTHNNKPINIDSLIPYNHKVRESIDRNFYDVWELKENPLLQNKLFYGHGIQIGNYKGNPIKWKIVTYSSEQLSYTDELYNNKIIKTLLLIADEPVAYLPYNDEQINISWDKSTLREWLNNKFYKQAFKESEQSLIKTVINYPTHKINNICNDLGDKSKDKVYLLSYEELIRYRFKDATNDCWWLRSTGKDLNSAETINYQGGLDEEFVDIKLGVKPVICITLNRKKEISKIKESEGFIMEKNLMQNEIAIVWKKLEDCLYKNKLDLIRELSNHLNKDSKLIKNDNGSKGTYKNLPGMFYVNCSRKGLPYAKTGHGINEKSHYFWIPIIYKNGPNIHSYILSLLQEDLDTSTGNIHHNFTKLQFLINKNEGFEIGGQFNPSPQKTKDFYLLKYNRGFAYPSLTEHPNNVLPYKNIDNIPTLDMKNPDYSPKKVAKFIWELIDEDIKSN